jgi:hypothetical protein
MRKYLFYILITVAGLLATWWIVKRAQSPGKRGRRGAKNGPGNWGGGRQGGTRTTPFSGRPRPGARNNGLGNLSVKPGTDYNAP